MSKRKYLLVLICFCALLFSGCFKSLATQQPQATDKNKPKMGYTSKSGTSSAPSSPAKVDPLQSIRNAMGL